MIVVVVFAFNSPIHHIHRIETSILPLLQVLVVVLVELVVGGRVADDFNCIGKKKCNAKYETPNNAMK
jgi:hypothetical protein